MHVTPLTDDQAAQALATARQLLERHDYAGAAALLLQARECRSTQLPAHALIEAHGLSGSFSNMTGLDCTIAPEDDIFRFFQGHPSSTNPLRDYFADGWRTLSELMLLLEAVDRPLLRMGSVLEFASGHGRFTRHLVKALPASRVAVSDVVRSAVDFSTHNFGVQGFASAGVPEEVRWPQQYELVFVLSLFSHLPRSTWSRWLQALRGAVAPGGLLVFSTHGVKAANFDHVVLEEDGFFFTPSSESQAIDNQEYGTAFTSESFVLAQIAQTWGADALQHRSLVHFWNHQDAYVLKNV